MPFLGWCSSLHHRVGNPPQGQTQQVQQQKSLLPACRGRSLPAKGVPDCLRKSLNELFVLPEFYLSLAQVVRGEGPDVWSWGDSGSTCPIRHPRAQLRGPAPREGHSSRTPGLGVLRGAAPASMSSSVKWGWILCH